MIIINNYNHFGTLTMRVQDVVMVFTILAAVVGVQSEAPKGYLENIVAGKAYKMMYQAQNWTRAKEECECLGASLAVPKSQEEFQFLQNLVRGMSYPLITGTQYKLLVWLGINNFEEFPVWKNVDGEDINDTGFSKWSSSYVAFSADPKEPHCVGMDAINPGLRDYWCHLRQPYICQIKVLNQTTTT